jgi:hypothetical protein
MKVANTIARIGLLMTVFVTSLGYGYQDGTQKLQQEQTRLQFHLKELKGIVANYALTPQQKDALDAAIQLMQKELKSLEGRKVTKDGGFQRLSL